MIEIRVPGKLYIAGEYAVLEPGGSAVLVGVDRFLTARLAPRGDDRITVTSGVTEGREVEITDDHPDPRLAQVLAAVRVTRRLAVETGCRAKGFDLLIESELDDVVSGAKYGLGSSGAVTVAVVGALIEFYGVTLDAEERLRLALLASMSVDPRGSGGDVAASLLGGWVAYTAPDRTRVCELLAAGTEISALIAQPWPHLGATPLPPPRDLRLLVGWTRSPVSTRDLVAHFDSRIRTAAYSHRRFVAESNAAVAAIVAALRSGTDTAVTEHVNRAGENLRRHADALGLAMETPALAALRALARDLGIAAKTSGAGGGDCGIALAPPALVGALSTAWRAADIHPLDLAVTQPVRLGE